jgi:AcrR family transcriptional regulator
MSTSAPKEAPAEPTGGSYHHGNLRAALVEAGLALLEKGDTADFSLRELARQLGVSPNATYRHFAGKEALMAAMAAEGFRRFTLALVEGAGPGADPVNRFVGAGHGYVRFACRNPALFRLMFGRFAISHQGNEELHEAATMAYRALQAGVASTRGVSIDDPGVTIAALHAWSIVHGLSHLILDGQIKETGPELEALIDAVIRGG